MKIYFLSSRPCALMLDGVFSGRTDLFARYAEIHPKDNVFAEFFPEGALPVGFFLTEKLRFSPPEGCEVYLLRDGIAVYVRDFPPSDFSLKLIAQRRFGGDLLTVFRQGALQLAMETAHGFFLHPLPEAFSVCSLRAESGLYFLEGSGMIAAFTEKGGCALMERAESCRFERGALIATLPLSDCLNRKAERRWALTEEGCFPDGCTIFESEGEVSESLLACAFFESALVGADITRYLDDNLRERAGHLKAFLGDYSAVEPCKDPFTCGLVRKKKERLFELKYFTVTVENGKISDIRG